MTKKGGNEEEVITHLEVLASLDGELVLVLAGGAFETEDNLLGGLGLLVEDGLGLTTVTLLFAVVTAFTLDDSRVLALLVLGHLVDSVLEALLALAVGFAGLGDVDLMR
jgi:hypothetical protein